MRYVALDFETGNASRLSACALGVSIFEARRQQISFYVDFPFPYNNVFRLFTDLLHICSVPQIAYGISFYPKFSLYDTKPLCFIGK